ncbi:hypothetical protein Chor_007401 [Crotalus horridus]
MRVNVDKVLERDQKLSELDERADALQAGAQVFESSAAALKRKYWWKNCKMMIMLGVICAIVVIAIAPFHLQSPSVCESPSCFPFGGNDGGEQEWSSQLLWTILFLFRWDCVDGSATPEEEPGRKL